MSLGFEWPLIALAGLLLLPLIFFVGRFLKSVLTLDIPLGPPGGTPFKPQLNVKFIIRLLGIAEFCGAFLLCIAAAGPRLVSSELVWLDRGADILFVVDISPSMAGLDMDGRSRFAAARSLALDFSENRPSDAIGLVAVGNEASLLVPPTVDRALLRSRLEYIRIGELGDGTALGLGLAIASLHIRNSAAPRRGGADHRWGEQRRGGAPRNRRRRAG